MGNTLAMFMGPRYTWIADKTDEFKVEYKGALINGRTWIVKIEYHFILKFIFDEKWDQLRGFIYLSIDTCVIRRKTSVDFK